MGFFRQEYWSVLPFSSSGGSSPPWDGTRVSRLAGGLCLLSHWQAQAGPPGKVNSGRLRAPGRALQDAVSAPWHRAGPPSGGLRRICSPKGRPGAQAEQLMDGFSLRRRVPWVETREVGRRSRTRTQTRCVLTSSRVPSYQCRPNSQSDPQGPLFLLGSSVW